MNKITLLFDRRQLVMWPRSRNITLSNFSLASYSSIASMVYFPVYELYAEAFARHQGNNGGLWMSSQKKMGQMFLQKWRPVLHSRNTNRGFTKTSGRKEGDAVAKADSQRNSSQYSRLLRSLLKQLKRVCFSWNGWHRTKYDSRNILSPSPASSRK